ncbi:hypothetical protein Tco_1109819 [Tanacetum coccineum]|uniref:Retrovirus-related Pol polyprotein from transposon TNT 1-94 n=1 Tax=Tanacetum coccineum TaxID=301880 RepID=A0ABQ5II79_9ASTR
MMTGTKFDIGKFDGMNDFGLWQVRMKALLEQQGLAAGGLVGDLASIDTVISDEDHALLLLTSLPSYYDDFVETLLYGRDTLKLEDVLATLNSRELDMCVDITKISRKRLKPGQTRTRERKSTQRAERKLLKVKNGQLKSTFGHLKVYTSPRTLIGGDPRKNDTVDMKEAQGNKAYTLEVLTKEAQPVTITDCHAGNPCELEIDLTAKSSSPIIEGMYGQDWKERAET